MFPAVGSLKVKPAKPDKKSVFVKKSVSLTRSKHNFKFDFPLALEQNENVDILNPDQGTIPNKKPDISCLNGINQNVPQYIPSDNSFRFNFEISEVMEP